MSRLDDAHRSVPSGPSPDDGDGYEPADDLDVDASPAGDAGDDDGEHGDGDGRSIENVRGELLRKQRKLQEEMLAEIRSLKEENQQLRSQWGAPSTAPSAPQTLDDMTIEQLEQARANVPEEQRAAFEAYLTDRKIDEKVNKKLATYKQAESFSEAEERANTTAFERWPELRDKSSEFYRTANRILADMGKLADTNPRAVLDAANEAGLELGLSPRTAVRKAREPRGGVAPGRSTKRGPGQEDAPELDEKVTNRLAQAMPGKKFTKEQLKRIAEREKMYKENINSYLRG